MSTRQTNQHVELLRQIRRLLAIFMTGLVVSGMTAFPLETEAGWLRWVVANLAPHSDLDAWVSLVHSALQDTNNRYPFMAYGTDWLAFAHLVIAMAFIGPWHDPVKNIWVIEFGMLACLAIFPLACIAGAYRHIPWFWRGIDCSFGVVGFWVLCTCYRKVKTLAILEDNKTHPVP